MSGYASEDGDVVVEENRVGGSTGTPSTDGAEDVAIMACFLVCVKVRNETNATTMEKEREGK